MEQLIEQLIAERPHFHALAAARPATFAVTPDALRYMFGQLKPGMHTLETGSGYTTVAFAIAGTEHVAITLYRDEEDRIRAYLDKLKAPGKVTFIHESSAVALPSGR